MSCSRVKKPRQLKDVVLRCTHARPPRPVPCSRPGRWAGYQAEQERKPGGALGERHFFRGSPPALWDDDLSRRDTEAVLVTTSPPSAPQPRSPAARLPGGHRCRARLDPHTHGGRSVGSRVRCSRPVPQAPLSLSLPALSRHLAGDRGGQSPSAWAGELRSRGSGDSGFEEPLIPKW